MSLVTSHLMKVKSGLAFKASVFFSDPVNRLSTQKTLWPISKSASQRCDPINPAPPVITLTGFFVSIDLLYHRIGRIEDKEPFIFISNWVELS